MKLYGWLAGLTLLAAGGCGGDSGSSPAPIDFGNNNSNVVVALGDSITEGVDGGDTPWPARLATLSGKNVINAGVGGEESSGALNRIGGLLDDYKPGYIIIFTGANDAIRDLDTDITVGNILAMVQAAKANKTMPIVATLLPMVEEHLIYNSAADRISAGVRNIAKSENVMLVELNAEFTDPDNELIFDGLHPNDLGNQIIALAFNDGLPR